MLKPLKKSYTPWLNKDTHPLLNLTSTQHPIFTVYFTQDISGLDSQNINL